MGSLRVGFVGCGLIAHAHGVSLRAIAEARLADVEIAVAYDHDPARSEAFGRRFGATLATGPDEVAAESDVVYVCTPTGEHLDGLAAAARAGRPVFCEKPLARSYEEALRLEQIADGAGVPVQVGLLLRTAPVFRQLQSLLGSGRLGRPMAVIARDDQYFPVQGHYRSSWRGDREMAGGGALLEHSIHDVDILQHCFGDIAVAAATTRTFGGREGVEDSASAMLQTASGLTLSLVTVWHQVLSRPSTRRYEVLFERGFVSFEDDFCGPLTLQTSESTETLICPPPAWLLELPLPEGELGLAVRPYVEENRAFLESVLAGVAPSPGLADAVAAHRVVDACYRSAGTGGVPVSLER